MCVCDSRCIQMHKWQKDKDLFNINSTARTTSADWVAGRQRCLAARRALLSQLAYYFSSSLFTPPLKRCTTAEWSLFFFCKYYQFSPLHIFAFSQLVQVFISMRSCAPLFAIIPILPAGVPVELALAKLLLFTRSRQILCFPRFRLPWRPRHVCAKPGKYVSVRARP